MKKLNKSQGVAIAVSLALMAYLFFAGPLMNLFNFSMTNTTDANGEMPQTGVVAEDVNAGTGEVAASGDLLRVHYVGRLTDGRVFDSSYDRGVPIEFVLGVGQVIRGWDEGVRGMREGGKRILTIAPDYGYGRNAVGPIPANSTLIFEVELIEVTKPQ